MKRILMTVATVAALLCTPVLATSAAAAPIPSSHANPATALCADVVLPNTPQANLGECISYLTIPNQAFSTHDCDAWLEIDPDSFYSYYDSYSQCVRDLRNSY